MKVIFIQDSSKIATQNSKCIEFIIKELQNKKNKNKQYSNAPCKHTSKVPQFAKKKFRIPYPFVYPSPATQNGKSNKSAERIGALSTLLKLLASNTEFISKCFLQIHLIEQWDKSQTS